MPAVTQNGDFIYLKVTDFWGTVQDLTAFMKNATNPFQRAPIDVTTPGPNGGRSTTGMLLGQVISQPQVTLFVDQSTVTNVLWPLLGKPDGSLWAWYQGTNAAPTQGDQIFKGTYTVFGLHPTGTPGNAHIMTVDLKPSDQGAVVPGWYPY